MYIERLEIEVHVHVGLKFRVLALTLLTPLCRLRVRVGAEHLNEQSLYLLHLYILAYNFSCVLRLVAQNYAYGIGISI
jgi:hypothetical protein